MSLKEQLTADMKDAMKAKEAGKQRLSVIRLVRGAVRQLEIDGKKELGDEDVLGVISKEVKQRRDSIEDFKKGGRLWTSDQSSDLVTYFTGCVPQTGPVENAVSLKATENDFIAEKLPKQNMIIYAFEKGDRKTVLENITNFLDPSIQK